MMLLPKHTIPKWISVSIMLFGLIYMTKADEVEPSFTLNQSYSGNQSFLARESIVLNPGFVYTASEGATFKAEIDPSLIFTPLEVYTPTQSTYKTSTGMITNSPTSGGVVGSLPGQFNVSQSGGASYSIPIDCPQGLNGMQPKLSLNYNSQAGNNIVGWGWNVGGISVISRSNKTSYFNGETKSVKWNTTDQMALDGEKLIKTGTISSNCYEYRKENDDQSKIIAYEIDGKGAKYFEVTTKNGLTFKYEPIFYSKNQESETIEVIEGFLPDDSGGPLDPLEPLEAQQLIEPPNGMGIWVEINRIESGTSQSPVYKNWILTRVTDNNGNYIDYNYSSNSEQTSYTENRSSYDYSVNYPVPIGYTDSRSYTITKNSTSISTNERINYVTYGNKNQELGKVSFSYSSSRAEPSTLYIAGNPEKFTYRLSNVRVYSNNVQLKRYDLSFISGTDRVESIKVTGQNSEHYNPTVFQYGPDTESIYHRELSIPSPNLYEDIADKYLIPKELNNDGLTDMVAVFIYKMPTGPGSYTYKQVYQTFLANIDTYNNVTFTSGQTYMDNNLSADILGLVGEMGGLETMHIKNLHSKSIVVPFLDKTDYWCNMKFLFIAENLQTGAALKTSTNDCPLNAVRDFNNDGYEDLFYLEQNKYGSYYPAKIVFNKPGSSTYREFAPKDLNFYLSSKPKKLFVNDFNADGLNDIFIVTESGYYFYKNNGGYENADGYADVTFSQVKYSSLFNSSYSRIESGDFNGDFLPDFILNEHCNNVWYFAINDGDGTFTKHRLSAITAIEESYTGKNDNEDKVHIMDFNQDGKSDVVILEADYKKEDDILSSPWGVFRSSYVAWYESTGTNVTLKSKVDTNQEDYLLNSHSCAGDFNGDGQIDILSYGANLTSKDKDTNLHLNYSPKTINDSKLITSITDGLGNKTYLEYQPLTCSSVYSKSTVSYENVAEIQMPIYVLKQKRETNSGGYTERISYSYTNALIHPSGRGFLGFETSKAVNSITNNQSETKLKLNTSYNILLPDYTLNTQNSTSVSKLCSDVSIVSKGGKRFVTKLNWRKNEDFLKGITELVTFNTYDDYLNPTKVTTTYANSQVKEEKFYQYVPNGSWCDNKVSRVEIKKYNENGNETRVSQFYYDSKGNITKKIQDVGDLNQLTTEYLNPDEFGNPQKVLTKANGNERSKTISYSTSGRFVKKDKDDHTGFTTIYNYNETTCLLNNEISYLGLTTTYSYDGFGRLNKTEYPNNTITINALQWSDESDLYRDTYFSFSHTSGESPMWVWHDSRGNEVRRQYYGTEENRKILVDTDYNSKGLVYKISKPYFAGDAEINEVTILYDDYGRVISETSALGETTTDYDALTTVITSPEDVRMQLLNNSGQVQESSINGQNIIYEYWPSGLVKTTTQGNGNIIETFFNKQGNRTKLIDSDAGTIETEFNGFNELTLKKHSKKESDGTISIVTTTYLYDDSGRLKETNNNGIITSRDYDLTTGYVKGMSKPGHSIIYTYDENGPNNFGRITTRTEVVDNKSFTFKFEYDEIGRIIKQIYPSSFYTTSSYDVNSFLTEIKDQSGGIIWKAVEANERNQLTQIQQGNQITSYNYDSRGLPESIISDGIISQEYQFNSSGNLDYRIDNLSGQKEVYKYSSELDQNMSPNQLKGWDYYLNNVKVSDFSISYDENANITSKSDIGYTMKYGESVTLEGETYNAGPNALTSIKGNPDLINDYTQEILYNDINKIESITENNKILEIKYGIDENRCKSIYKENGQIIKTKYYLGNYEEIELVGGQLKRLHYITASNGISAIYVETNGVGKLYHIYKNYLGSFSAITDADNNLIERVAFDAWGNRVEPNNWRAKVPIDSKPLFDRGYTMHEHLGDFGLINMNGRVYDPSIARFISPDPRLQNSGNPINFNRYAYCYNNPYRYNDPNGEFVGELLTILAFAYFGGVQSNFFNADNPFDPTDWDWSKPRTYIGVGLGALAGYSMTMQHCEWLIDTKTGEKVLYSHLGDGKVDFKYYGKWIDSHTAFQVDFMVVKDVAFGGVDNIQALAGMANVLNATSNVASNTESLTQYSIVMERIAEGPKSTVSKFTLHGPVPTRPVSGYILEPGGPSTIIRNQDLRIPADTYTLEPYKSEKYPNNWRVYNELVPKDRYILVHSGNYHTHTLGCLLPGDSYYKTASSNYAVSNSKATMNALRNTIGKNNVTLYIYDIKPETSLNIYHW